MAHAIKYTLYTIHYYLSQPSLHFTLCLILRWTRREECDFYRVVSTFGVEKIKREPGLVEGEQPEFDWNRFRTFARLDKKTDESLSRYFRSFVAMCRRVCHLRPGRGEGNYCCACCQKKTQFGDLSKRTTCCLLISQ